MAYYDFNYVTGPVWDIVEGRPKLFKRSYELYIGKPVPVRKTYGPNDTVLIDNYIDKKPGPNTFLIKDNHITFSCKKDVESEPNKATISIYNPDPNIIEYVENFSTLKLSCIFRAGYGGDNVELFRGTIESYEVDTSSPDIIFKLKVADGKNNLTEAQSNRFYPAGTSYSKIIKDLSQDLGLPLGVAINQQGASKKPLYFAGKSSLNILHLSRLLKADFSVQNGAIWYFPENSRLREEVYKITPSSGLLFDVEPYSRNGEETANDKASVAKQIRFSALLNGYLLPNKTVYVESSGDKPKYKGYYKIIECKHSGGYESTSPWVTEVIAREAGNII